MRRTKPVWDGLESIEDGDAIKYVLPNGILCETKVERQLAIISTPSCGRALRFYSERVSHRNTDFTAFERVVAEEWITHWRGTRVRSSSAPESQAVDSSQRKGPGRQAVLPITGRRP